MRVLCLRCFCPCLSLCELEVEGGAALRGLCDGKDIAGHLGFLSKLETSSRETERATLGTCYTWCQA